MFSKSFKNSYVGAAVGEGIGSSFGFGYDKGKNIGFMGRKGTGGVAKNWFGPVLGSFFTVQMAHEGYQENGVIGAVGGVANSVATSSVAQYAMNLAKTPAFGALAIGVGVGLAGYAVGKAGIAHKKQLRNLEMSGGDQMLQAVGSERAATMRQRSTMALNNSHLNGRMSLGNEAFLMHRGY